MRNNITKLLKIILLLLIGFLIAWKANTYYGKREYERYQLAKIAESIQTAPLFEWEMEQEGEILSEVHDLENPRFSDGMFSFTLGEDPYLYLNLKNEKIDPQHYFFLTFRIYSSGEGKVHIYFWCDNQLLEGAHSAPISIREGWHEYRINLSTIRFFPSPAKPGLTRWGGTSDKISVLRFDPPEGLEGLEFKIDWIKLKRGAIIVIPYSEFFPLNDSLYQDSGNNIRQNFSSFFSRPIGLGSIDHFLSISWDGERNGINVQTRTGSSFEIDNTTWESWSLPYLHQGSFQIRSSPNKFLQCRININNKIWPEEIPIKSIKIFYLDSHPSGEGSLIFGSNQLITVKAKAELSELNKDLSIGNWIRVLMEAEDAYEIVNRLAAEDINMVGCFDLKKQKSEDVLNAVAQFKNQIRCWELFNLKQLPPSKSIWLIKKIKNIDIHCLILPTRTNRNYFETLALVGLYDTIKETPTPELSLDRGFGWFLIISIIFLLILVGLGKELGYNFKFGIKELKFFSFGLLLIGGLNLPLIRLMGEKIFRLPDWMEISAAISRYAPSAIIQEFVRALLILIIFKSIMTMRKNENFSWAVALLISSILFSLGHLGYPGLTVFRLSLFLAITFIAGMIFGMVFIKTRSLVATSVLHLCSNLLLFTFTIMKL
jgi:membrane protease YdiL (CAAX protease family)